MLGGGHPEVGLTLHNLAVLHHAQELDEPADEYYRRALDIFQLTLATDHPHAVACREDWGQLKEKMQK